MLVVHVDNDVDDHNNLDQGSKIYGPKSSPLPTFANNNNKKDIGTQNALPLPYCL